VVVSTTLYHSTRSLLRIAVSVVSLGLAPLVSAAGLTETVYPTGIHPTDAENVQAAIEDGGRVLLKARDASGIARAFNFGPPTSAGGFVFTSEGLTQDLEILGERSRGSRTTIRGGFAPIILRGDHRTTVRGIFFENPRSAAIVVVRTAGLEIAHNHIANVVGDPAPFLPPGATKGQGIWLSHFIGSAPCLPCPAEDIRGEVSIHDNVIENVEADEGFGVVLYGTDADVRVLRNQIRGVNTAAIYSVNNHRPVFIANNYLEPGPERSPILSFGDAILIDNTLYEEDDPSDGPTQIVGNTLVCENAFSWCIDLWGPRGSNIVFNRVRLTTGGFQRGVSIIDVDTDASGNLVALNRIEGSGEFALAIQSFSGSPEIVFDSNGFLFNQMFGFDALVADVFLDFTTENSLVLGECATYIDLGTNNVVACGEPVSALRAAATHDSPPGSARSALRTLGSGVEPRT